MSPNRKTALLALLTFALLLALAAPASAQTTGKMDLECLTVQWQVQGDNAQITLFLNHKQVDQFLLTADDPIKQENRSQGDCSVSGSFKMMAKSAWGSGSLIVNIVIKQGSNTWGHQGVLAKW